MAANGQFVIVSTSTIFLAPSASSAMLYYVKLFVITLITLLGFFAIDIVWLALVARGFYRSQLKDLLADSPNWYAAFVFYALFVVGMMVFVILPGLQAESWKKTLMLGAFYGLITYATYDLTNLATLKDWPLTVSIVDILWGMVLATAVSAVGFSAGRWLGGV